uniref:NADH-ubiquinone oxidoreductase chain 2 n=1 Tax=Turneroconcha magnifica TaxID=3122228 RepID=A0A0U2SFU4_9BIVA|nr:NADH dehydrogenase subunit 2 [Calyptogena magnifica]ALP29875.1 NADH dehydrogenase subunit 2 [Calyptogena magnifica]
MLIGWFVPMAVIVGGYLLVGGIFVCIYSVGLLGMWVGMELSFFGAVGVLGGSSVEEVEGVQKYFIIQVFSSIFLLIGFLLVINFYKGGWLVELIMMVGLMMKLGLFPFYFWIPSVMGVVSWVGCFVVSVVQKFNPIWILVNLMLESYLQQVIEFSACLTGLVGCIGGIGVLQFRVLLAFSSMVHLGYMVFMCLIGWDVFLPYMALYFCLSFSLMMSLWACGIYSFLDLTKCNESVDMDLFMISLYMFSFAGIPPLSGCFMKAIFLVSCWEVFPIGCVVLFLSSGVSLFYYSSFFTYLNLYWGSMLKWQFMKSSVMDLKVFLFFVSVLLNVVVGFGLFLSIVII